MPTSWNLKQYLLVSSSWFLIGWTGFFYRVREFSLLSLASCAFGFIGTPYSLMTDESSWWVLQISTQRVLNPVSFPLLEIFVSVSALGELTWRSGSFFETWRENVGHMTSWQPPFSDNHHTCSSGWAFEKGKEEEEEIHSRRLGGGGGDGGGGGRRRLTISASKLGDGIHKALVQFWGPAQAGLGISRTHGAHVSSADVVMMHAPVTAIRRRRHLVTRHLHHRQPLWALLKHPWAHVLLHLKHCR